MAEILLGIGVILILVLLWVNNSNLRGIYGKLWQLYEVTNKIHSLLRDKLN